MLYLLLVIAIWLSGTIASIAIMTQNEKQHSDVKLGALLKIIFFSFFLWVLILLVVLLEKLFEWINLDRVVIKKKTDKYASMKPHYWSD